MIGITITVNTVQARADLRGHRQAIIRGLGRVTTWAGKEVERKAKASLKESKSGRKYPNLPNRSSAPGQAPAYQFGGLDKAIQARKMGALRSSIKSGAFYAGYLEDGTSKMDARPYMHPALDKTVPEYIQRIVAMIEGG